MGAYARSREALLRWSMPDTKALAHYAERSFRWQQSKLESVLHPVLWRVGEWRERGLMGRGQMRERTDDAIREQRRASHAALDHRVCYARANTL